MDFYDHHKRNDYGLLGFFFFFIKRRANSSNHWHGTIEPNSNWKPNDYLPLTWKVILTSEPWNCFIQRLVHLKGILVLILIYFWGNSEIKATSWRKGNIHRHTHSICLIFLGFWGIACCGWHDVADILWHEWGSCSLGFSLEFYFCQSLPQWWLFLTSILHAFSFVYKGYFTLRTRV